MVHSIVYVSHTHKLVYFLIFGRKISLYSTQPRSVHNSTVHNSTVHNSTVHNLVFNGHCTIHVQH